jgi:uncharacterized RDD family membrane protein YckC
MKGILFFLLAVAILLFVFLPFINKGNFGGFADFVNEKMLTYSWFFILLVVYLLFLTRNTKKKGKSKKVYVMREKRRFPEESDTR